MTTTLDADSFDLRADHTDYRVFSPSSVAELSISSEVTRA